MDFIKTAPLNRTTLRIQDPLPHTVTASMMLGEKEDGLDLAAIPVKMATQTLSVYYRKFRALKEINLVIPENLITALIGPSGCGKSTLLRTLNRMNDLVQGCRLEGQILLNGESIYDPEVNREDVQQRIAMLSRELNLFPSSVFENVTFGLQISRIRKKSVLEEMAENSLCQAGLWEDVKDNLGRSGLELSAEQQHRLSIARALAGEPDVILMEEPTFGLDPIATLNIETLLESLKERYTIVIVTHDIQQAARVSDFTTFFMNDNDQAGTLVEVGATEQIFTNPHDPRTEAFITGRTR